MKKLNLNEPDLVAGLKARDDATFSILYDHYAPTLLGIIYKIVKDQAEAENILQDVFVKIWLNIHQYDAEKGRLFTWMLNISRNTAINFLRANHFSDQVTIQDVENGVYKKTFSVESEADLNTIGINGTVQRLDVKLKKIIELIYYEGHTQQEVSKILDMPLGTVKTRTRLALQQLRNFLKSEAQYLKEK